MTDPKNCKLCGQFMSPDRPFPYCIECNNVSRMIGYMDYAHKTAPTIIMVAAKQTEAIRRLNRQNNRSR